MIKVTFYAQDMSGHSYTCLMRSTQTYTRFCAQFKYYGGFNRFESDFWEVGDFSDLVLIPANQNGFVHVYNKLYTQKNGGFGEDFRMSYKKYDK